MDTPINKGIGTSSPYDKQKFLDTVGETYSLETEEGKTVELTLKSVIDSEFVDTRYDRFSLCFTPPDEKALPDETYLLENKTLGPMKMLISATPVFEKGPKGYEYEAIFNLLRE